MDDRVWRILIQQIAIRIESKQLWKNHKTIDKERRRDLIHDLEIEIVALADFGSKVFDEKREDIINYANNNCTKEVS